MPDPRQSRLVQGAIPDYSESSNGNGNGSRISKYLPGETPPIDTEITSEKLLIDRLTMVLDAYRNCQPRILQENVWTACIQAYEGLKPGRTDPTKDSVVIKEIFRQMHTLKPQYNKQFFSQPKLFKYAPNNAGDEEPKRTATDAVHYQIRKFRLLREVKNFSWCKLLLGTSYIRATWEYFAMRWMEPFKLHDPEYGTWWKRKTGEIIQNGPQFEFIPPNEIFSHPFVEDPRNSPFCFRIQTVSGSNLKTMVRKNYLDKEAVKQVAEDKLQMPTQARTEQYRLGAGLGMAYDTLRMDSLPDEDVPHELVTCWALNGMEYCMIDREVLGRACMMDGGSFAPDGELEPGPNFMFTLRNYPQFKRCWGIPEPYTIIEDQYLLNEIYTNYRDSLGLTSGPMWQATMAGVKALANFSAKPGAILQVNQIDKDIKVMGPYQFNKNLTEDAGFVKNNMIETSGLFPNIAGSGDNGANTASMGIKLQNAATVRIEDGIDGDVDAFEELYGAAYILNNIHMSTELEFPIDAHGAGYAFGKATPDHFKSPLGLVEVQLANQMETDPEMFQKAMQFLQSAGKMPVVNLRATVEKMAQALWPKTWKGVMSNPAQTKTDSFQENKNWEAFGRLDDPDPAENHQDAIQIHQTEFAQPAYLTADPAAQLNFQAHVQMHMNYAQAIMQAQGQAASQSPQGPMPPMPGAGAPVPQANAAANGMMNMAADGAAQAGAPPPQPGPPQPPGPTQNGRPQG